MRRRRWPETGWRRLEDSDVDLYALRSTRVVLPRRRYGEEPGFEVVGATIVVRGERIEAVHRHEVCSAVRLPADCVLRDAGDLVVLPGVVDAGARFGECPFAEESSDCWEGFAVGTRAAAAGGITTTVDLASLDAPLEHANDVSGRAELAASSSTVDVALAVRLEARKNDDDEAKAASMLADFDACVSAGAVAATAYLTPPSWAARGVDVDDLAKILVALAARDRRKSGPRGVVVVPPVLVNTVKLSTEELGAASPFRHLPFSARLDAKSPLMLLPFYQVESSPANADNNNRRRIMRQTSISPPKPNEGSLFTIAPSPVAAAPLEDRTPGAADGRARASSRCRANAPDSYRVADPTILAGLEAARLVSSPADQIRPPDEDDGAASETTQPTPLEIPPAPAPRGSAKSTPKKARAETIWEVIPFEETVVVSGDDNNSTGGQQQKARVTPAAATKQQQLSKAYRRRNSNSSTGSSCGGQTQASRQVATQSSRELSSDDDEAALAAAAAAAETPTRPPRARNLCLPDNLPRVQLQHPHSRSLAIGGPHHSFSSPRESLGALSISPASSQDNTEYVHAVQQYSSPPRSSRDVKPGAADESQSWVKSLLQAELATYAASNQASVRRDRDRDRDRDRSRRHHAEEKKTQEHAAAGEDGGARAHRRRRSSRATKSSAGKDSSSSSSRKKLPERSASADPRVHTRTEPTNGLLDQILGFIPVAYGGTRPRSPPHRRTGSDRRKRSSVMVKNADGYKRHASTTHPGTTTLASCHATTKALIETMRRGRRKRAPTLPISITARPPSPPRLDFARVSSWADETSPPPMLPLPLPPEGGALARSVVGAAPPPSAPVGGPAKDTSVVVLDSTVDIFEDDDGVVQPDNVSETEFPDILQLPKSLSVHSATSDDRSDDGDGLIRHRHSATSARMIMGPVSPSSASADFLSSLFQRFVFQNNNNSSGAAAASEHRRGDRRRPRREQQQQQQQHRNSSVHLSPPPPPPAEHQHKQRFVVIRKSPGFRSSGLTKHDSGNVRSRSMDDSPSNGDLLRRGPVRNSSKLVRVPDGPPGEALATAATAPAMIEALPTPEFSPASVASMPAVAAAAAAASSSCKRSAFNKVPAVGGSYLVRKKPIIASISKGNFVELKGSETLTSPAPPGAARSAQQLQLQLQQQPQAQQQQRARYVEEEVLAPGDGDDSSPTRRRAEQRSTSPSADEAFLLDTMCSYSSTENNRFSDQNRLSDVSMPHELTHNSSSSSVGATSHHAPPAGPTTARPPSKPLGSGFGRKPRPPPIRIFKENDQHTRRAVRQDYSLYCDNHRSSAGAEGLQMLWSTTAHAKAMLTGSRGLDEDEEEEEEDDDQHRAAGYVEETFFSLDEDEDERSCCSGSGSRRRSLESFNEELAATKRRSSSSSSRITRGYYSSSKSLPARLRSDPSIESDDEFDVDDEFLVDEEEDDEEDDGVSSDSLFASSSKRRGLSPLHVARVATLQTVRVLEDLRIQDLASTPPPLLGGPVAGSVACYNLLFAEEDVPYGATIFKVQPPIRHEAHRRALWAALRAKTLRVVTSGHSPVQPEGKPSSPGDFSRALAGSLAGANELVLSALWTAARHEGFDLGDLASCLSAEPATLLRLAPRKGVIRDGADADFVLFDPDAQWTVDSNNLVAAAKLEARARRRRPTRAGHNFFAKQAPCLYDGKVLTGKVVATLLRGRLVYHQGLFRDAPIGNVVTARGRVVRRAAPPSTANATTTTKCRRRTPPPILS